MIDRYRIAELLEQIALALGNGLPAPRPPDITDTSPGTIHSAVPVDPSEWAYVKGIAAHEILALRDKLRGA